MSFLFLNRMEKKMRKIIFTFLAIFILSGSFNCALAANDNNAIVYHFNNQTKSLDKQTIPNFGDPKDSIERIITAGRYAWALSKTDALSKTEAKISFYDGWQWNQSIKIDGVIRILNFNPGYPMSGRLPVAWLIGEDSSHKYVTAYFDGKTWTKSESFSSDDYAQLSASSGYVWLRPSDEKKGGSLKFANVNAPLAWTELSNLPIQRVDQIHSFTDNEAACYAVGPALDYSKDGMILIKIDANGKATVLQKQLGQNKVDFIVNNDDIFVSLEDYSPIEPVTYFTYSHDGGKTWSPQIQLFDRGYETRPQDFFNGNYCAAEFEGFFPIEYKVKCINVNSITPAWLEFSLPEDSRFISNFGSSFGTWIFANKYQTYSPLSYKFDFNNRQLINTNINDIATELTTHQPMIRAMGADEVVTCGYDLNNHVSGFYFDGVGWSTLPIDPQPEACALSMAGGEMATTKDKNVWIFPTAK